MKGHHEVPTCPTIANIKRTSESKTYWALATPGCYLFIPLFFPPAFLICWQRHELSIYSLQHRVCTVLWYFHLFESASLLPTCLPRTTHNRCWSFFLNRLSATSRIPFAAISIAVCLSVCLTYPPLLPPSSLQCLCEGSLDIEPMILCWLFSSSRSLMNNWTGLEPSTDPWGQYWGHPRSLLATGLQLNCTADHNTELCCSDSLQSVCGQSICPQI